MPANTLYYGFFISKLLSNRNDASGNTNLPPSKSLIEESISSIAINKRIVPPLAL